MEETDLIKSMTGYGRAINHYEGREITVEVRSVNNRYLDCNVKLPRIYSYTEDRIKQIVKEHVTRGKVDVFITVANTAGEEMKISLNRPVLEGYLAAMQAIASDYPVKDDITVTALSRLPEVFLVESQMWTKKNELRRFMRLLQMPCSSIMPCELQKALHWNRIC